MSGEQRPDKSTPIRKFKHTGLAALAAFGIQLGSFTPSRPAEAAVPNEAPIDLERVLKENLPTVEVRGKTYTRVTPDKEDPTRPLSLGRNDIIVEPLKPGFDSISVTIPGAESETKRIIDIAVSEGNFLTTDGRTVETLSLAGPETQVVVGVTGDKRVIGPMGQHSLSGDRFSDNLEEISQLDGDNKGIEVRIHRFDPRADAGEDAKSIVIDNNSLNGFPDSK